MGIIPEKPKKKNLSQKDLSRLKNNGEVDVPILPLEKAIRELRKGNTKEADEAWNFFKHGERN